MSNKFKDINIKNRIYYFFNDMINIEDFNPNNIKKRKVIKKYKNPVNRFSRRELRLLFGRKNN